MLVTDHPHLFETGGENYHTDFYGWDYLRGHEGDPWKTRPDPSWIGRAGRCRRRLVLESSAGDDPIDRGYDRSRTFFRAEEDFPGPRTMTAAARLARARRRPTTTAGSCSSTSSIPTSRSTRPSRGRGRYDDEPWDGEQLIWPPYADGGIARRPPHRARRPATSGPTTAPSSR